MASAIGRPSVPARDHRLRRAADRDPDRHRVLDGRGIDAAVARAARGCRPGQVTRSLSRSLQQQLELLGEQRVVVVEVVAEEREGLDERAAPGHDLGAPAGQQVERGELLVDADRIVGATAR